jgi:VCBS repeat-containing protein
MRTRLILFSTLAVAVMIAFAVVIIKSSNAPPTAESGSVTTPEDTPVSITIVGGSRGGKPLTYSVLAGPSHGTLSGTEPNLIYSPAANFNGVDSFTFKVNDGKADSAEATVSVTVTPVSDPPVANADSATAREDAAIVTIDVLANDTDPDGRKLTVVGATQGANGSVTINTDGTLGYAPNKNFSGTDTFNYTVSDGQGGTATATVSVVVEPVNDAPVITSRPVETARVWTPYTYDVKAKDADPRDQLTYSLTKSPEGMTINSDTGRIEWRPTSAQAGSYDVVVRVADDYKIRASDTQSFTITVTSLSSPLTTTLTVADCFGCKGTEKLSAKDKIPLVTASDNNRLETEPRSSTCYDFCDASIPNGASIKSVVVYVEHYEDSEFPGRKLEWAVGTGWPAKPVVWVSIVAPIRPGQAREAMDSWDVTSAVDTPAKANALQLLVQNDDAAGMKKTYVDYVYAVVQWY